MGVPLDWMSMGTLISTDARRHSKTFSTRGVLLQQGVFFVRTKEVNDSVVSQSEQQPFVSD